MAVSSAERSAGSTAGVSHEAAADDEAVSALLLLRRRTDVDAVVEVGVDVKAEAAATTLA